MTNNLSHILQVAKEILQDAGLKGMNVKDISEVAVRSNKNMGLCVEDFQKKVQSALAANLKLKNIAPTFAQVKWGQNAKAAQKDKPRQGWYRLKITREPVAPIRPLEQPPTTGFAGKAGEHAVIARASFLGRQSIYNDR